MSLSHLILLLPVLWALDHPWEKNSDNFQIAERVQTEHSLARETSLYLIIDLQEGTVTLKAKGVPLRSYLFQNFEWIGRPPNSIMAHTLRAKLPFIEPHVTNIPSSEPQNTGKPFVPLPITVKDMPHRFTLECSDEFVIRVHSERDPSLILHLMDRILGKGEKFFEVRELGSSVLEGYPARIMAQYESGGSSSPLLGYPRLHEGLGYRLDTFLRKGGVGRMSGWPVSSGDPT